ncbi:MAG TPA: 23S rRNA (uracil(1939)-C(5))-methyltransferase RlmD [Abditibacterium sp.]|jgi:23S rRNA (uracil1939-C5)-methyltransferase
MNSRIAQVKFHGLATGGEAVGRDENGKTVFAPFGAPDESARVAIESEKKSFARGLIQEIAELSPARADPFCPQFRPQNPEFSCGGCAWQHLELETQREAKRAIVHDALSRLGGQTVEVEKCRGGAGRAYRNKADFVIGRDQNGAQIGFFARESHDLVPAAVCPIQSPHNEAILRAAREILTDYPDFAFDAATGRGVWRRLVARVDTQGETIATLVLAREAKTESVQIAAMLREKLPNLVGVLARTTQNDAKLVWSRDFLIENVNDLKFRVSGAAFWQVNAEVSPLLAQTALEMAQVEPGQRALDLFCGAGLFALHLARAGAVVTGIEFHRGAIKDAIFNAKQNGLKADFRAGDAARELKKHRRGDFDLILLDPPRAGAASCLPDLVRLAPARLVYISCDPATLARDAGFLGQNGYKLQRAVPFDLFPQTAHVETAALFVR